MPATHRAQAPGAFTKDRNSTAHAIDCTEDFEKVTNLGIPKGYQFGDHKRYGSLEEGPYQFGDRQLFGVKKQG